MGDSPMRPARRPRRPRPKKTAPSSISSSAVWLIGSAAAEDLGGGVEPVGGADDDQEVTGGQGEGRGRRGVQLPGAHDPDPRDPGPGAQGGRAERATVE